MTITLMVYSGARLSKFIRVCAKVDGDDTAGTSTFAHTRIFPKIKVDVPAAPSPSIYFCAYTLVNIYLFVIVLMVILNPVGNIESKYVIKLLQL